MNVFLQHVTAEGTALVKQAEDAASNKKVSTASWVFLLVFGILIVILIQLLKVIERIFLFVLQAEKKDIVGLQEQVLKLYFLF